jgi:hypothetical protein
VHQRQVSPHTIASYRDTFRLLLKFAHARLHTPPARLSVEAVDAPLIGAFLDHLEKRVYADHSGPREARRGSGGRNAVMILSFRYSSSR